MVARPDGLVTKMGVLGSSCRTLVAVLDVTMKRSMGLRLTEDGEQTGCRLEKEIASVRRIAGSCRSHN